MRLLRDYSPLEFQSLFWWILLLNQQLSKLGNPKTKVSILVLVDFALKLERFYLRRKERCVSILVLVDFALKRNLGIIKMFMNCVSILVLVDFALKLTSIVSARDC